MSDELRTIGTATRLETANRHDEGTHWSDWYVGMTFDTGMSHETAPVVLRADAEAIIERLRAALATVREDAMDEARQTLRDQAEAARRACAAARGVNPEAARRSLHEWKALEKAISALKSSEPANE